MAPSLGSLSDEVVYMILEEVNQISPKSLLNTCLVSQRFCRLSNPLIYKKAFALANKINSVHGTLQNKKLYTFQASTLAHTRYLTVATLLNWSAFSKFLPELQHLESIRWTYWEEPFPVEVKRALLKSLPKVKLFIEKLSMGHRTDDVNVQKADLDLLKSLISIPNIHTIKVEINYEHPVSMRWLKDVLLTSKNLTTLHLTLPRIADGRIDWDCDFLGAYDLCVKDDEKLESLTELVYEARCGERPMIPISFFNWSKIRHLELRGHGTKLYVDYLNTQDVYFQGLVLQFTLSSSFFHLGYKVLRREDKTIDEFVAKMRCLETLELTNPLELMPVSSLAIHGSTLRNLSIRSIRQSVDPYSVFLVSRSYSIEDLKNLNHLCPHISHLTLDLDICSHMPYESLVSLARFPQLITLKLYLRFHLGNCCSACPDWCLRTKRRPEIETDRLTVQHMFSYISIYKAGRRLRKLEVMMGDFPRNTNQGIMRQGQLYRPNMLHRPNILFIAQRDDYDQVFVTDNVTDHEDPAWNGYFKAEKTGTMGQAWQDDMEETMALEEEADLILRVAESLDDIGNTDSLFGEV